MRMKKISLVLAILFLVFSVEINPSAYALELSSSKTMDKYEEIGKEFLKEYYYSIDMKQDMNVSKYIKDENVLQYVDLKHDIIKNRNVRFFFLHYYDRDKAASTQAAANQNEVIIPEIDLQKIDDFFIGSEPPHLIYADRDKVIFETTGGVYVYDMKGKSLLRSFDTVSFASESYSNVLRSAFATQDGKQLIFIFSKGPGYVAAYRYSLEDKFMSELTGKEYAEYLKKRFEYSYLDPGDELYQKSSGLIITISGSEYVYLTFQDWKVSTINVVYVQDDKETVYSVFTSR